MNHQAISLTRSLAAVLFVATLLFAGTPLTAAQTETTIHAFKGGSDPLGGLVADANGALYGTTYYGGEFGQGSVYEMVPPSTQGGAWTVTTIYSFSKTKLTDGGHPSGSLLLNLQNHKIRGTARLGGSGTYGVVYELSPPIQAGGPWTEAVLYTFTGGLDGGTPVAGVISDTKGVLYGTAASGGQYNGGVVFRLSPPKPGGIWTEKVLHSFKGGTDGSLPLAGLIFDNLGALYGTTWAGGQRSGGSCCGMVFQLKPPLSGTGPWTENVLHRFTGASDSAAPSAGLIFDSNGALYGTTAGYGPNDHGNIFQLSPPSSGTGPWTETILHTFTGGSDGAQPEASLIFDSTGALYGTTHFGGSMGVGTAFKLSPPSTQGGAWTEYVMHSFSWPSVSTDGAYPQAPLLLLGNTFSGTTFYGGAAVNAAGTVFEITQ